MEQKTTSSEDLVVVEDSSIRPFEIEVPDEAVADMRRRIEATNWPERETVDDSSQGVPLETMQASPGTGRPTTPGGRLKLA